VLLILLEALLRVQFDRLVLDPYLLAAVIILSITALFRAIAIRKYGRRNVEEILWARLIAWAGILLGYLLLFAHLLLK